MVTVTLSAVILPQMYKKVLGVERRLLVKEDHPPTLLPDSPPQGPAGI
jgi:hypothetical protein